MATHSSTLAWRIPWPEEPGGLESMGLPRVGHDLATRQQTWNPRPTAPHLVPAGSYGTHTFSQRHLPASVPSAPSPGAIRKAEAALRRTRDCPLCVPADYTRAAWTWLAVAFSALHSWATDI